MYCCEECYPCCDYCEYVIQEMDAVNGKYVSVRNVGCELHSNQHHQELARGSHYCKDFYCRYAEHKEKK